MGWSIINTEYIGRTGLDKKTVEDPNYNSAYTEREKELNWTKILTGIYLMDNYPLILLEEQGEGCHKRERELYKHRDDHYQQHRRPRLNSQLDIQGITIKKHNKGHR